MSATSPPITVVVVNDQVAVCKMWQQLLERTAGMACPAYALDGYEAIELAREFRPDVVLMDILMPGMRGDEAMHHIQDEFPDTVVIMYSADGSTEVIAREAGADDFLLMPVPPARLADAIRRAYDRKHDNA